MDSAFGENLIWNFTMPRQPRVRDAELPQHVILRGNNKAPMFFGDADREFFLRCLRNGSVAESCDIHTYVLMTNHVHLFVTPRTAGAVSRLMQDTGRRYVENVNLVHARTGTLFEGRFKSKPVLTLPYAMACLRYIEQNPVRAGMVMRPGDYLWSSCRHHLGIHHDVTITEHAVFVSLGATMEQRASAYANLCNQLLDVGMLGAMRATPARGRPRKAAGECDLTPDVGLWNDATPQVAC